jgi:hypothetical protein
MSLLAGAPNSVVCVSVGWCEFEVAIVVLELWYLMFGELEWIVGPLGRRGWLRGSRWKPDIPLKH